MSDRDNRTPRNTPTFPQFNCISSDTSKYFNIFIMRVCFEMSDRDNWTSRNTLTCFYQTLRNALKQFHNPSSKNCHDSFSAHFFAKIGRRIKVFSLAHSTVEDTSKYTSIFRIQVYFIGHLEIHSPTLQESLSLSTPPIPNIYHSSFFFLNISRFFLNDLQGVQSSLTVRIVTL